MENSMIEDKRLSFRARGILCYLLSLPPEERAVNAETLATKTKEGRDAIRTATRELESLGYVTRKRYQDARGYWHTGTTVTDSPAPKRIIKRRIVRKSK